MVFRNFGSIQLLDLGNSLLSFNTLSNLKNKLKLIQLKGCGV
jgi:hypothetical protein